MSRSAATAPLPLQLTAGLQADEALAAAAARRAGSADLDVADEPQVAEETVDVIVPPPSEGDAPEDGAAQAAPDEAEALPANEADGTEAGAPAEGEGAGAAVAGEGEGDMAMASPVVEEATINKKLAELKAVRTYQSSVFLQSFGAHPLTDALLRLCLLLWPIHSGPLGRRGGALSLASCSQPSVFAI